MLQTSLSNHLFGLKSPQKGDEHPVYAPLGVQQSLPSPDRCDLHYTFTRVVARCDELDNVFVLADVSHKRNLVEHQLAILAVVSVLRQNKNPRRFICNV